VVSPRIGAAVRLGAGCGIICDVEVSAEVAAVLRRIIELLSRGDCDVAWSTYGTPGELRAEIEPIGEKAEAGITLDDAQREHLRFLFLPTGPVQETSLSSGWGAEFVSLAARLDRAMGRPGPPRQACGSSP
jgi:hypothetical protein